MKNILCFIGLLCLVCSCVRDNDDIYYPIGDIDIERGNQKPTSEEDAVLIARSYNNEDYVLDTIARYPLESTNGKLTFMFSLKNQMSDFDTEGFDGVGKSEMKMSIGYKNGNFAVENQHPVYVDETMNEYAVKLRLKGELTLLGDEWIIDNVYTQLSDVFHFYPPADYPQMFMCKGGLNFGTFDSRRRTCTFDISYQRYDLSFNQLYFNLFINLAGQKREENIRLRIDKESYLEIYKQ